MGVTGKLKTESGELKFTRAINSNELFSKQPTPYVYPLLKAHKLTMAQLLEVKYNEVCEKIPSRLVVGMGNCQMTRVQAWLEHFLTPLSQEFGFFEYTKDSNSVLREISNLNKKVELEHYDINNMLMFSIDVKALYPSVKFLHLQVALKYCFETVTNWSDSFINTLIKLIIYTLEHQQIKWNDVFYMLTQGIPTGGKHCVPLANIFLTFILITLIKSDSVFKSIYDTNLKLWQRYIDDCLGIFMGKSKLFDKYFSKLKAQFKKYDLDLTIEKSYTDIVILDIEIYKDQNQFCTREHRKDTSSLSYLKFGSAHPNHVFKGIVKGQMYRLRRLCSKTEDYDAAISNLKDRCLSSGYDKNMVEDILSVKDSLIRTLHPHCNKTVDDVIKIRWVVLSNSRFEKEIHEFVSKINEKNMQNKIKFEIVKETGSSLGKILFNNNDRDRANKSCGEACNWCSVWEGDSSNVKSNVDQSIHKIDSSLSCQDSGIYAVGSKCESQYTGKTTGPFNDRFGEHFSKANSTLNEHLSACNVCTSKGDFEMQFLENVWRRGKYSLSEREYLWNERIKGSINIQKTLKK